MIDIIKSHILDDNGKIIPQRVLKGYLIRNGWYDYLVNYFTDTTDIKEIIYRISHNLIEAPKCITCGASIKFKYNKYTTYCNRSCSNGNKEVCNKISSSVSNSLKEAYNIRGDEIKNRRKRTLFNHYGECNSSPFSISHLHSKAMETFRNKYTNGDFSVKSKSKEIARERSIKLWYDRGYTIEYFNNYVKILNGCDKHGDILLSTQDFNNRGSIDRGYKFCLECYPQNNISNLELSVKEILDDIGVEYIENCRNVIHPMELDFYIPSKKIAIECNGIYWHSEKFKSKDYHINKTKLCKEMGIRLVHIWEDEFYKKPEIIKSMFKNMFNLTKKLHARKCIIKELTHNIYYNFLNENHIQGGISSLYKYGLYYEDDIVAVMGVGKTRVSMGNKFDGSEYELIRYCVKKGLSVAGGASKLLTYISKEHKIKRLISYARADYSNGNLYEKLGFTFSHISKPNYTWVVNGKRENRFKYRKDKIVNENNSHLSESQIMHGNGYYRVFDCGNYKYIKEYNN